MEQLHQPTPDPVVTYVDYEAERPDRLPYPRDGEIPPGYVVRSSGKALYWAIGGVLAVTLPLAGVGISARSEMTAAWIPIAGPFIAVGQFEPNRHRDVESPFGAAGTIGLLLASGVAQAGAWGLMVHAASSPSRRYLVREDLALVPKRLPGGGWGLEWTGTF